MSLVGNKGFRRDFSILLIFAMLFSFFASIPVASAAESTINQGVSGSAYGSTYEQPSGGASGSVYGSKTTGNESGNTVTYNTYGGSSVTGSVYQKTVSGSVYEQDGVTKIKYGTLQYVSLDSFGNESYKTGESTNWDGDFSFNLQTGKTYRFVEIEYYDSNSVWKRVPLHVEFTVTADGKIISGGFEVPSLSLTVPKPNFTAKFTESGTAIANSWMEIEHLDEKETWGDWNKRTYTSTDADGKVALVLKPGHYQVNNVGYNSLSLAFTIEAGVTTTVYKDFSADSNVQFQVQKNGVNVTSSYDISFGSTTDSNSTNSKYYYKKTTVTGAAYTELPEGNYQIYGVGTTVKSSVYGSYDNYGSFEWTNLNQKFEVTSADTADHKKLVTINLKDPNLLGTVKDKDGNPVSNAWISLRGTVTNQYGYYDYYGTQSKEDGSYKISLPSGKYFIDGYSYSKVDSATGYYKYGYVKVEKEVILTETPLVFDIQPSKPNVTGTVYKKDGTTVWGEISLVFAPRDLTDEQKLESWKYEKRVEVAQDGSYSAHLQDGQYTLKAISTPTRWIELNGRFKLDIVNNAVAYSEGFTDVTTGVYNIVQPTGNVTGKIKNIEGVILQPGKNGLKHAWVNVQEKVDWSNQTPGTNKYPKYYGKELQEDGSFDFNIVDPGDYVLQSVSLEIGDSKDSSTWKTIQLNAQFQLTAPNEQYDFGAVGPNVYGTLLIEGQAAKDGGIAIRPQNLTQDQQSESWKYEKWANTDQNGKLELYLKPGDYQVYSVYGGGQSFKVEQNFTVETTGSLDISDKLVVTNNVYGVVRNGEGQPVANAWIDIRKGTYPNEQYFGIQTDEEGKFKTKLGDNVEGENYAIRGISRYEEGKSLYIPLSYEFRIVNGSAQTVDGKPLPVIEIQPNVKAVVKKSLENGSEIVADAWVNIKPASADDYDWSKTLYAHSDSNGQFTTFLSPGKYKVTDIGAPGFWSLVDIKFDVDANGTLQAADGYFEHVMNGQLIVAPPAPNLKGIAYGKDGNTVDYAWISIRPKNAEQNDYAKNRWFNTNTLGEFSGRLENDQTYIVTSLSSSKEWAELGIEFTIDAAGNLSGSTVIDGKLIVKPKQPNVAGTVFALDNSPISNGWITFKPAAAKEHDWKDAKWTETDANGQFKLNLNAGDYVVVHAGNGQKWIDPRLKFTVAIDEATGVTTLTSSTASAVVDNKLVVTPPAPNVTGSVYKTVSGSDKVGYGWFSLARVNPTDPTQVWDRQGNAALDTSNNQILVSDREDIWPYTFWFNTDETGNFSFFLDPGSYYVLYAGGPSGGFEPGTLFSVNGNQQTSVEIRPAGNNLTGTVTGLKQEELDKSYVQYWLRLVDANDTSDDKRVKWIAVEDDGDANTDGTATFSASLPLGSYKIEGIQTPFGFTGLDDSQVAGGLNLNIGVSASLTRTIDLSSIKSVTGQVHDNGTALSNKRTTVKVVETNNADSTTKDILVQTDLNGKFVLSLKAGYTYKVTQAATDNGWVDVTVWNNAANETVNSFDSNFTGSLKVSY